jgi:dTDP-4-amino-4,6-dideoxygalactose transaminase
LQALQLEQAEAGNRDHLLDALNAAGIAARPVWKLMHQLQPFEACPRMDLRKAQALEQQLINIPSSANLGALESVDDLP